MKQTFSNLRTLRCVEDTGSRGAQDRYDTAPYIYIMITILPYNMPATYCQALPSPLLSGATLTGPVVEEGERYSTIKFNLTVESYTPPTINPQMFWSLLHTPISNPLFSM